jgi:hypothetical protein
MLAKIVYNCTPESLADVDQAEFIDAFENEVRVKPIYRDLQIEVTFNDALRSEVTEFSSDDWKADISSESEFRDEFQRFAEKAFSACLA